MLVDARQFLLLFFCAVFGLPFVFEPENTLTMSHTFNVPEAGSSRPSDEQDWQQPQASQPGFITADDNPFYQEQQQISQITNTLTYSPFAKTQRLLVQPPFPFNNGLDEDPLATDDFTADRGCGQGLSAQVAADNSFFDVDIEDGVDLEGGVLSPTDSSFSQARSVFDSTPTPRSRGTPITPSSFDTSSVFQAGETQTALDHVTLSQRLVLPSIHERRSSDQGEHHTTSKSPLDDNIEADEYTAALLATLASQEDTIAALNARLRNALAGTPRKQTRDARGRWASSSAHRVQRPRGNNGGRRRRRTQAELLMEAGIKFGYLDVPNVSIVTGEPLVALLVEREGEGEAEDEVKMWARKICEDIWRSKMKDV